MPSAHPDSHVYPEATGEAAKYFSKHASEEPLKLYSGWFCPFVQRVLLVLHEKNIPFQYIEVNPYDKPESLMRLNPRGLVPTLEVSTSNGNKPLVESTVICEYLDEVYDDPSTYGRQLMPPDPYERARARIWIGFVGSNIVPSYHRWLQYQGEEAEKGREEFLGNIKKFTEQLDPEGPFWLGKEVTLPDLIMAPWIVRLWVFDHFKNNGERWPTREDGEVWGRWQKFVHAITGLKSVRETMSDKVHYLPLYDRYAKNIAQSEAAKAIRSGRPIP